ncbi:uncharacterized protein HaLaN_12313 [Haematococcus lacustris]|uniref:Uncharacterized protein n=1 Tax=Haematococcus lacustris TaxID=44745 RepID=A0A699Z334_HAELA|nr:uncharacterized protein HaLaN_12313 [Haematococcus lacustris]
MQSQAMHASSARQDPAGLWPSSVRPVRPILPCAPSLCTAGPSFKHTSYGGASRPSPHSNAKPPRRRYAGGAKSASTGRGGYNRAGGSQGGRDREYNRGPRWDEGGREGDEEGGEEAAMGEGSAGQRDADPSIRGIPPRSALSPEAAEKRKEISTLIIKAPGWRALDQLVQARGTELDAENFSNVIYKVASEAAPTAPDDLEEYNALLRALLGWIVQLLPTFRAAGQGEEPAGELDAIGLVPAANLLPKAAARP